MKEKNWYTQNGWYWDKRDHMWKRVYGEKEMSEESMGTASNLSPTSGDDSKPFTKKYNILIFDNCQYPLKIHEVMYKK